MPELYSCAFVLVWGCIEFGQVILLGSSSSDDNVYVVGGSVIISVALI